MPIYQISESASSAVDIAAVPQAEMSHQLIARTSCLDRVAAKLPKSHEGLQIPLHSLGLVQYEGSDSESLYSSTGFSSPDDQRSLSGIETPYEESLDFQCVPASIIQISSQPVVPPLLNIPTELHLLIFSHLDPVDSTCLGLTNAHFYNLQKALNGNVTLETCRKGRPWEFHGKQECRHCGNHRCQLYMHLRDWMPTKYEYCAIRQVYGLKAQEGVKKYCYRSNPLKPGRCGRHRVNEG